jgi:hypothetical protein
MDIVLVLIAITLSLLIIVLGLAVGVFYDKTIGVLLSFVGVIYLFKYLKYSNKIL